MTTPMHPTRIPDLSSPDFQNNAITFMTPVASMLSATTDLNTALAITAQANQVIERTRQLWQL